MNTTVEIQNRGVPVTHSQEFVTDKALSVPVRIAAKVYKKDPCWIRAGLIVGWLPIGFATRNGERITSTKEIGSKKGRINYYISPKLLYEQTGFLYQANTSNETNGVSL